MSDTSTCFCLGDESSWHGWFLLPWPLKSSCSQHVPALPRTTLRPPPPPTSFENLQASKPIESRPKETKKYQCVSWESRQMRRFDFSSLFLLRELNRRVTRESKKRKGYVSRVIFLVEFSQGILPIIWQSVRLCEWQVLEAGIASMSPMAQDTSLLPSDLVNATKI